MSNNLFASYHHFRRELGQLAGLRLKRIGMGLKQVGILTHLSQHAQATPTELAAETMSDMAAISRAVASLEKSGWVRKSQDPVDSRKSIIELTASGKKRAAKAEGVRDSISADLDQHLNPAEMKELSRLLEKAACALRQSRTEKENE